MSGKREGFRNDIAGLRALAVLLVLASHFGIPGLSFGFVGVDIFFVISGYLITRILYKEYLSNSDSKTSEGHVGLTAFYLRRIRRLVPAAATVIILTNLVSFFLSNSESRAKLFVDSKWALLFLANVSFLRSESNYFQLNSEPSMLQHYWSLSVEEQFYFVWPILFIVAAHFHKLRLRNKYFRFNSRLISLICVLSLFSFIFLQFGFQSSPKSVYFSIFTRAWELGIGGLAGILAFHKKNSSAFSRLERYVPALASLLICAIFIDSGNWALLIPLPVLTTAFLLYSGEQVHTSSEQKQAAPGLLGRFTLFIGEISYSLYLVHWPVYVLCARYNFGESLIEMLLLFPITIFLAYLLWSGIEKPFQKLKIPKLVSADRSIFLFVKTRKPVLVTSILLIVGSLYSITYPSVSTGIFSSDQSLTGLQNDPNLMNYAQYEKLLVDPSTSNFATTSSSDSFTTNTTQDSGAVTDLESWKTKNAQAIKDGLQALELNGEQLLAFRNLKFDMSPFEKSNCGSSDTVEPPNCSLGNFGENALKVALVGDSKMGHLAQPIIDYFKARGWKVDPLIMNGCHLSSPVNDFRPNCSKRSETTLKQISSGKYDLVLSAEYPSAATSNVSQKTYYQEISRNTKKLVIFQQTPLFPSAQECVDSANRISTNCMVSDQKEILSWKQSQTFLASLSSTKIDIIDTVPWYCANYRCPTLINGYFVLRDGNHFSYTYAKQLTPVINYYLDRIIAGL